MLIWGDFWVSSPLHHGERVHVVDLGGPEQLREPDLSSPLTFLGKNTHLVKF